MFSDVITCVVINENNTIFFLIIFFFKYRRFLMQTCMNKSLSMFGVLFLFFWTKKSIYVSLLWIWLFWGLALTPDILTNTHYFQSLSGSTHHIESHTYPYLYPSISIAYARFTYCHLVTVFQVSSYYLSIYHLCLFEVFFKSFSVL